MKTQHVLIVILFLAISSTSTNAASLGTAFTYQGKLASGGQAASGIYDFRFRIYDLDSGGSPLSTPIELGGLTVSNGLFTTSLDFGPGIFNGDARWLEIGVRTHRSPDPYHTLPLRQRLTPAPQALWAQNAGTAVEAVRANAGAVSAGSLSTPSPPSTSQVLIYDGTSLAWMSLSGAGPAWNLTGNAGTAPGASFLGTTDERALQLKVNNQRVLLLEPTADGSPNVIAGHSLNRAEPGVFGATIGGGGGGSSAQVVGGPGGTVSGGAGNQALGLVATVGGGQANVAAGNGASVSGGAWNRVEASADFGTIPGGTQNTVAAPYGFAAGRRAKATHEGAFVWADATDADFASTEANQFLIRAAGGVGIGTNDPQAALHVAGVLKADSIEGSALSLIGTLQADRLKVGVAHTLDGLLASIAGGFENSVTSDFAAVGGGQGNIIAAGHSVIGGGGWNMVHSDAYGSTISGGNGNVVYAYGSTIAGGAGNEIQADANSAAVGGGIFNRIEADAAAATIAGGTNNVVSAGFAAIGGGEGNTIQTNALYGTIAGGYRNTIETNAYSATISGGRANIASAWGATIAGGHGNLASGICAFVGGGGWGNGAAPNTASGTAAGVVGGFGNTASGYAACVGGGGGNKASGYDATIAGGGYNLTASSYSSIGGGLLNSVEADHATIPGGFEAVARSYGQQAYASGGHNSHAVDGGSAQTSLYVVRNESPANSISPTELFLDGSHEQERMKIPNGSTWAFEALVVGRTQDGVDPGSAESAGFRIRGVIQNARDAVGLLGATGDVIYSHGAGWYAVAEADNTHKALVIKVSGGSLPMRWVATVRTSEVMWPQ